MKEENKLIEKVGKDNPFTLPEGYFDKLSDELMNKVPEKPEPEFKMRPVTTWDRLKLYVYLAAMFVGAAVIIKVLNYRTITSPEYIAEQQAQYEMMVIDEAVDNSMMDDYSFYLYLTDAD